MAGVTADIRVVDDGVKARLEGMEKRASDLRPLLKVLGELARTSVMRNFEVGGRPTKWKVSKRAAAEGGQTLVDKGLLKQSIASARLQITDRSVSLGTNVRYAAAHHFGFSGSVQIPEHKRLIKEAFGRKLKFPVYAIVRAHMAQRNIPARPFMLLQADDEADMREEVAVYLAKED